MTFLAPLFLSLAVLVGVPLAVHLLRKRVQRTVEFPALRFLFSSKKESNREKIVRNRLILFLRILAVLSIVAAAARPLTSLVGTGHPPVALGIVLDQSMSTQLLVDGRALIESLKDVAGVTVSKLSENDRAWLLTSDGRVFPLTGTDELPKIESNDGRGNLVAVIKKGAALVKNSGGSRAPVLLVLTDGQANAMDTIANSDGVPVVVYFPQVNVPSNRAVLRSSVSNLYWRPTGRVLVEISTPDSTNWRVALGDSTVMRGIASSTEGNVADFSAVLAAPDTGWISGRIEIDPDDFPGDDSRFFAARAGDIPRVWLAPNVGPFVSTAFEALQADGRIRLVGMSDTRKVSITGGAESISAPVLVFAPSDPLHAVAMNRQLASSGIPWRLGRYLLDTVTINQTSDRSDKNEHSSLPANIQVFKRYELLSDGSADGDQQTTMLATSPWIVSGPNYVLVGSAMDPSATNLPLVSGFLPWLRGLVSDNLSGSGLILQSSPGEVVRLPSSVSSIRYPDGTEHPVPSGGFSAPAQKGVYFFMRGASQVGVLVVNAKPEESQLVRGSNLDWVESFSSKEVTVINESAEVENAVFDRDGRRSLMLPFILLALFALFLESWLGRSTSSKVGNT